MTNTSEETQHKLVVLEGQAQPGQLELTSKLRCQENQEKTRSFLACWVLIAIFGVLVLSVICGILSAFNWLDPKFTRALFDVWKTGLLPIITFILGYYFSKQ